MKKKAAIFGVALAIGFCGAGYYYHYQESMAQELADTLTLSGNVDIRETSLAFRQSDRVAEILVEEGDTVTKGQLIARLDNAELTLSRQKTAAQVQAQENAVARLHNGTRAEDLAQARARAEAAEADSRNAASNYWRMQQIFDSVAGISEQELDNARRTMEAAAAKTKETHAALAEAMNGARSEDIAEAEANLTALKEELARQDYLLSQYELTAPSDGVVRSRLLEVGDMASANTPVVKLSLLDKKWVRAYVTEEQLGRIYEGQEAEVLIDSQKDKPIKGQIGYISSTAEFTPKNVQTDELRTALLYEVRVYVEDSNNVLRMGMPATVKISL